MKRFLKTMASAYALLLMAAFLLCGCTSGVSANSHHIGNASTTSDIGAVASPQPTQATSMLEWENKYAPVLDKYREFSLSLSKTGGEGDFSDWGHPWDEIAPDIMDSTQKFGYAFRDMDGNGTPELFLQTSDGSIWAMYTFVDGAPKLLYTFWSRNECFLDQSDVIYRDWSDGAYDWGYDLYRISENGRELTLVERVAVESTDENGNSLKNPRYFKSNGYSKEIISKAEANTELSKFPEKNDNSGLKFIPLK